MFDIVVKCLTTLSAMVAALSIIYTAETLAINKQKYYEDYERSRREFAVNLTLSAVEKIGSGRHCVAFAYNLTQDETNKIINHEIIQVRQDNIEHLNHCIAGREISGFFDKTKNLLNASGSYYVSEQITRDLNLFEVVFSAYYNGIADPDTIKNNFGGLITSKQVVSVIDRIRAIPEYKDDFQYIKKFINGEQPPLPAEKKPLGVNININ